MSDLGELTPESSWGQSMQYNLKIKEIRTPTRDSEVSEVCQHLHPRPLTSRTGKDNWGSLARQPQVNYPLGHQAQSLYKTDKGSCLQMSEHGSPDVTHVNSSMGPTTQTYSHHTSAWRWNTIFSLQLSLFEYMLKNNDKICRNDSFLLWGEWEESNRD